MIFGVYGHPSGRGDLPPYAPRISLGSVYNYPVSLPTPVLDMVNLQVFPHITKLRAGWRVQMVAVCVSGKSPLPPSVAFSILAGYGFGTPVRCVIVSD